MPARKKAATRGGAAGKGGQKRKASRKKVPYMRPDTIAAVRLALRKLERDVRGNVKAILSA